LFLTCSDARIDPNLLTGTQPGDLFVVRNAGNFVPPHGSGVGAEAAALEYAVAVLGVQHIILCGHTRCGVAHQLLQPDLPGHLPAVRDWLVYGQAARLLVASRHAGLPEADRWLAAVEENVLVQLGHLRTHPPVAVALAAGGLQLHGWVYHIETGEVTAHDPARGRFVPLNGERVGDHAADAATAR
jgi:carbonic anhydrase